MGFLAGLAVGGVLGGLFGKKKKAKTQTIYPKLEVPYLSEQQIQQNPITRMIYERMLGMPEMLSGVVRPEALSGAISALEKEATAIPDLFSAQWMTHSALRPMFNLQLGEALGTLHQNLARALGTPRGGALGELMRRQARELEMGYMAQTLPQIFEELQAQRRYAMQARELLPRMLAAQAQLTMLPTQMQLGLAEALRGTFVAPQVIQQQYTPSPLAQIAAALAPLLILGGGGGISF